MTFPAATFALKSLSTQNEPSPVKLPGWAYLDELVSVGWTRTGNLDDSPSRVGDPIAIACPRGVQASGQSELRD